MKLIRYHDTVYMKVAGPKKYFAYGSNMSVSQMKKRCPAAKLIGKAKLQGYRIAFCGQSRTWGGAVATLVKDSGYVPGVLYAVSDADIEALDAFEGHPTVYKRTKVDVDGESAITYIKPKKDNEPVSPKYLLRLWKAYKKFGFDHTLLIDAVAEGDD